MNLSKITTVFLTILYSTFASISQAATLIYDEDIFYSIYETPSEIIAFTDQDCGKNDSREGVA